jgi:hypothetical protein
MDLELKSALDYRFDFRYPTIDKSLQKIYSQVVGS